MRDFNRRLPPEKRLIKVPFKLLLKAAQKDAESDLQLYLLLKLLYPEGKAQATAQNIQHWAYLLDCSSRTIYNKLERLKILRWLTYNKKTKYWLIRAIYKVSGLNSQYKGWKPKLCLDNIQNIRATIGYYILLKLSRNFKRRLKQKRVVTITEVTYNARKVLAFSPIALRGAAKFHSLSYAKIQRLKDHALRANYIERKHSFKKIDKAQIIHFKQTEKPTYLLNGDVQRGIDLIRFNVIW